MPRACCRVCHCHITIGPSGTEYGHRKHQRRDGEERCPHRPESVDPDRSSHTSAGGRSRWGDA